MPEGAKQNSPAHKSPNLLPSGPLGDIMNTRTLHAFVEVVRQGGFSQAGKVIAATQSTVSKAVRRLEDELGVPLLTRAGHRSTLTEAGHIAYRHAIAILSLKAGLVTELDNLIAACSGKLRLGLPPIGSDILFAAILAGHRRLHPQVEIQLVELGGKRLAQLVLDGELDLCATLLPLSEKFEWRPICNEPLELLIAAEHPLALAQGDVEFSALRQHPFIMFEDDFCINDIVMEACRQADFVPTIVASSSQVNLILELVSAGLGVAFMPHFVARRITHSGITRLRINDDTLVWRLVLAWRNDGCLSQAAQTWLNLTVGA